MTHPVATLPKLTVKELAVLKAIDLSEYGEYLTDTVWSFTIAQNLQFTDSIKATSIPGIVSSLNKKGYVINGQSDGEKVVGMTREGAQAYVAANGGKSAKPVEHVTTEAQDLTQWTTEALTVLANDSRRESSERQAAQDEIQRRIDAQETAKVVTHLEKIANEIETGTGSRPARPRKTAEEKRLAKNARAARRRAARKAAKA